MSSLHVIVCLLDRCAHEKSFLKALIMIQSINKELYLMTRSNLLYGFPVSSALMQVNVKVLNNVEA